MSKSTKSIHESKNYDQFKIDERQRIVNPANLRRIKASMRKHGWLTAYPMHVSRNCSGYVVHDGQHRMEAAMELGIELKFVIEKSEVSPGEINAAQRAWVVFDFIDSYSREGLDDYTVLKNFIEVHKLPASNSANLLMGNVGGSGNATGIIKGRRFKVKARTWANEVAYMVNFVRSYVAWASQSAFIHAMSCCFMVNAFDSERMRDRIEAMPGSLIQCASPKQYLELLEKIYNYRIGKINQLDLAHLAKKAAEERNSVKN